MSLYEVALRIRHDCPFSRVTEKYPSSCLYIWCNRESEVMEFRLGDPSDREAAARDLRALSEPVGESWDEEGVLIMTTRCTCDPEDSVLPHVDACNLFCLSPVVHRDGWEYYELIAFDHRDLEDLFQRLAGLGLEFEILRKAPLNGPLAALMTLPAESLLSGLTKKQVDALVSAYSGGYYRFPRRVDLKGLARRQRVPRTTLQEHLRKAQNKIMNQIMPYVLMSRSRTSMPKHD